MSSCLIRDLPRVLKSIRSDSFDIIVGLFDVFVGIIRDSFAGDNGLIAVDVLVDCKR